MASEFILVEHKAIRRGLHWDLRIKKPNKDTWLSFVLNSDPSKLVNRTYVVRTDDHNTKEATFTGRIASGYGAGTILEKDRGACEFIELNDSKIKVKLSGKLLNDTFSFIRMGDGNVWLVVRRYENQ